MMITNIAEDRPIERIEDDLFGRGQIVDTISKAIIHKSTTEHGCYVIGLYGKWGEGKSSVFNMVKAELLNNRDDNILISSFNPWLFHDHESLLMAFFNTIAKEPISRNWSKAIKKYAPLVSIGIGCFLSVAGMAASQIGKAIPKIDIDATKRKKEVSEALVKSGKHLVVFIDDIDRLDKEETHAILKLIKQNADFDNVIYLLAMDVEMVAKSISCRFGMGEISDGYNFIEKIVQVPITLPKIQTSRLRLLLGRKLREIFSNLPSTHSSVTEHIETSAGTVVDVLSDLFETRRDIVRYTNQIQFILPTLYEEVNISDLCLLEAIKLFHPVGYEVIRRKRNVIFHQDQDWVLSSLTYRGKPAQLNEFKEEHRNKLLNNVMQECPEKYSASMRKIVKEHLLRGCFHDYNRPSPRGLGNLNYFDKYFIGCTPDNKISDQSRYQLLEELSDVDFRGNANILEPILSDFGWDELRNALSFIIDLGKDPEEKNVIAKKVAISTSLMHFSDQNIEHWSFGEFLCSIMNQMFLSRVNPHEDPKRDEGVICATCEAIVTECPIGFIPNFASILYQDLNVDHKKKVDLVKLGVDRIVKEQGADELLKLSNYIKVRLFSAWAKSNQVELDLFIAEKASNPEFDVVDFLEGFVDDGSGNTKDYTWIEKIFPHNKSIYDVICAKIPENEREGNHAVQAFLKSYKTIILPSASKE